MAQLGDAEQREMDAERVTRGADGEEDGQVEGEGEANAAASGNPDAANNNAVGEQDVSFDSLLVRGKDPIANQNVYHPNNEERIATLWINSLLATSKTLLWYELFRAFHQNDEENDELIHVVKNMKSVKAALKMHNLQDLLHFYDGKILVSDSKLNGSVTALININPRLPVSKAWLSSMLEALNTRMDGILKDAYESIEQNYLSLASIKQEFEELGLEEVFNQCQRLDDPVIKFCEKVLKLHKQTMKVENKENKDDSKQDSNIAQKQKRKRKWGKNSHKKNKNKNKRKGKGNGKGGAMEKNSKNKP